SESKIEVKGRGIAFASGVISTRAAPALRGPATAAETTFGKNCTENAKNSAVLWNKCIYFPPRFNPLYRRNRREVINVLRYRDARLVGIFRFSLRKTSGQQASLRERQNSVWISPR